MKRAGRPAQRSSKLAAALRPPYDAPIMTTFHCFVPVRVYAGFISIVGDVGIVCAA